MNHSYFYYQIKVFIIQIIAIILKSSILYRWLIDPLSIFFLIPWNHIMKYLCQLTTANFNNEDIYYVIQQAAWEAWWAQGLLRVYTGEERSLVTNSFHPLSASSVYVTCSVTTLPHACTMVARAPSSECRYNKVFLNKECALRSIFIYREQKF